MTALNSQILQTDAQIGFVGPALLARRAETNSDIKQARQLLQNLILSNPKHAPGWIAAASLGGRFSVFRTS